MASLADLTYWLDAEERPSNTWYIKRLAGNDTLANGAHQAGPYIPKDLIFKFFPSINRPDLENPDKWFDIRIDSHSDAKRVRAIWYNNKLRGGSRNETRITNFGGASSALLNPESTGSIAVFSFHRDSEGETIECRVWVCSTPQEEELVEEKVGFVEPGQTRLLGDQATNVEPQRTSCWLDAKDFPAEWLTEFPSGKELIKKSIELKKWAGLSIDDKLIARRDCEYELFRSLEHAVEWKNIKKDFSSIDDFIATAQTILQRRKSRSGRSLELHIREIFLEEGLKEGRDFQYQPETENGERPDFIFPSEVNYKDASFPRERLCMLGIKTTVKDRWAQILKEANRIEIKHLLTLQEGISQGQFNAISEAKVKLVVPSGLASAYHPDIRPNLISLEKFIGQVKALS